MRFLRPILRLTILDTEINLHIRDRKQANSITEGIQIGSIIFITHGSIQIPTRISELPITWEKTLMW